MKTGRLICLPLLLLTSFAVNAGPITVGAAPQGDTTAVALRVIKYNFSTCTRVTQATRLSDGTIRATCDGVQYRVLTVYSSKEGKMVEVAMNCAAAKRLMDLSCG